MRKKDFVKYIIRGRSDALSLSYPGNANELSDLIRSNVGVSQCIPISAQLFIIYAGAVMENYASRLKNTNIQQASITHRNAISGRKWASDRIQQYNIKHNGKSRGNTHKT